MSIVIFATGFIDKKPELTLVGRGKRKVMFDVVSTRRAKKQDAWVTVYERATFEAWDDEAEDIASRLEKGHWVTCTGNQESWEQYKRYRLTSWTIERRGLPEDQGSGARQPQPAATGRPPAARQPSDGGSPAGESSQRPGGGLSM